MSVQKQPILLAATVLTTKTKNLKFYTKRFFTAMDIWFNTILIGLRGQIFYIESVTGKSKK